MESQSDPMQKQREDHLFLVFWFCGMYFFVRLSAVFTLFYLLYPWPLNQYLGPSRYSERYCEAVLVKAWIFHTLATCQAIWEVTLLRSPEKKKTHLLPTIDQTNLGAVSFSVNMIEGGHGVGWEAWLNSLHLLGLRVSCSSILM